jgi:hypothetical protein
MHLARVSTASGLCLPNMPAVLQYQLCTENTNWLRRKLWPGVRGALQTRTHMPIHAQSGSSRALYLHVQTLRSESAVLCIVMCCSITPRFRVSSYDSAVSDCLAGSKRPATVLLPCLHRPERLPSGRACCAARTAAASAWCSSASNAASRCAPGTQQQRGVTGTGPAALCGRQHTSPRCFVSSCPAQTAAAGAQACRAGLRPWRGCLAVHFVNRHPRWGVQHYSYWCLCIFQRCSGL